jgi:hypothetical protein
MSPLLYLLFYIPLVFTDYECFDKYIWMFDNCSYDGGGSGFYGCQSTGNNSPQIEFSSVVDPSQSGSDWYTTEGKVLDSEIVSGSPPYVIISVWFDPFAHVRLTLFGLEIRMQDGADYIDIDDGTHDIRCEKCYNDGGSQVVHNYIFIFVTEHSGDGINRLIIYHEGVIVFAHSVFSFDLVSTPYIWLKDYGSNEHYLKLEVVKPAVFLYPETIETLYGQGYESGSNLLQVCQNYTCRESQEEIKSLNIKLEECYNKTNAMVEKLMWLFVNDGDNVKVVVRAVGKPEIELWSDFHSYTFTDCDSQISWTEDPDNPELYHSFTYQEITNYSICGFYDMGDYTYKKIFSLTVDRFGTGQEIEIHTVVTIEVDSQQSLVIGGDEDVIITDIVTSPENVEYGFSITRVESDGSLWGDENTRWRLEKGTEVYFKVTSDNIEDIDLTRQNVEFRVEAEISGLVVNGVSLTDETTYLMLTFTVPSVDGMEDYEYLYVNLFLLDRRRDIITPPEALYAIHTVFIVNSNGVMTGEVMTRGEKNVKMMTILVFTLVGFMAIFMIFQVLFCGFIYWKKKTRSQSIRG